MKPCLKNISLLLVCAGAALSAAAIEERDIQPFMILPYSDLPPAPIAGRGFYLPKHLVRLQITFKVDVARELDEKADPSDPNVPRYYSTSYKAKPTGATLATVRVRDEDRCYFMAAGQVTSFFRDKKYASTFSEDGFFLGSAATFEDKTLQIAADVIKTAAIPLLASMQTGENKLTPEQRAKEQEKAAEALRLKLYLAATKTGVEQLQKDLATESKNPAPDLDKITKLAKALEVLQAERSTATASRAQLLSSGEKSEVVVFTGDVDPVKLVKFEKGLPAHSKVEIPWDSIPAWLEFTAKIERDYHADAVKQMSDALDLATFTTDFVGVTGSAPLDDPKMQPAAFPYQGILLRQPRYARAALHLQVGPEGNKTPVLLGQTEGATLKFGQYGRIVAVPVKSHFLLKGDFAITLNADGEILSLGSSATAAGSGVTAGISAILTNQQAYEKARAGPSEQDQLTADTARMKAVMDHDDTKAKYDAKYPKN